MAATEDQVNWNLSQRISDQIDSLLQSARRANLSGRILDCFHFNKELRLLINHHFNPEELERLDNLERDINNIFIEIKITGIKRENDEYEYSRKPHDDPKKKRIMLINNRALLIEKYRKGILNLLDGYGYLMERKSDASKMW